MAWRLLVEQIDNADRDGYICLLARLNCFSNDFAVSVCLTLWLT